MRRQVGIRAGSLRAWAMAALALAILAGGEAGDSASAQAVTTQAIPPHLAQAQPQNQAAPQIQCTTTGSTTYCTDGTRYEANTASTPGGAAAADGKPARQVTGKSAPIEYQRDDLRIFGVDNRIRRLGETNYDTGQQGTLSTYSGRNCARFNTSIVCD